MSFFPWFGAFFVALLAEVSVVPQFFGGFTPSLARAALILGVAYQRFWPGFAFAALAGFLFDAVAGGGIHALLAIATFLAMRAFLSLAQWEEPLDRIGAVAFGLLLQPILRLVGARLAGALAGAAVSAPQAADVIGVIPLQGAAFTIGWFLLFAWLEIRRARRRRSRRVRHL